MYNSLAEIANIGFDAHKSGRFFVEVNMPWKIKKEGSGWVVVDDKGKKYSKKPLSKSRAKRQVRALYAAAHGRGELKEFSVLKEKDGGYRWVLRTSTAFRDRDGEIVSTKALQDDCDRADKDGDYGPLLWWHLPQLEIGDCDFNMVYGRTLIESGTFKNKEIGEAVAKEADKLQASLGFRFQKSLRDENAVFHKIRKFERSLLPGGRASNFMTALTVRKELVDMATVKEKIEALAKLLNDNAMVSSVLSDSKKEEGYAEEIGTEFKEKRMENEKEEEEEEEEEEEGSEDEKKEVSADASYDEGPFVGDLSPDEFGSMIANVITKAVEPFNKTIKELQDQAVATKEADYASRKDLIDTISGLEKRLASLEGETTKAAKGYVASESEETVVAEDSRLKDSAPHADPMSSFIDGFVLGGGQ